MGSAPAVTLVQCPACKASHEVLTQALPGAAIGFDCASCGQGVVAGAGESSRRVRLFSSQTLGKYRLVERLGLGGMGEVYRAILNGAAGFEKQLAVKKLLPQYAADQQHVAMLVHEAKLSSLLDHRNLIQVFELTLEGDDYLLAMEYVDGLDLERAIRLMEKSGKVMPLPAAGHVFLQVLEGLSFAHELMDSAGRPLGLVHRDISPSNIFVSKQGVAKLGDFGIAKIRSSPNLTGAGFVRGKPQYTPIEVFKGIPPSVQSDIYSTGLALYEVLIGRHVIPSGADADVLAAVAAQQFPAIENLRPDLPRAVVKIVRKAIAPNPRNRFRTAREFGDAFARALPRRGSDAEVQHFFDDMKAAAGPLELLPKNPALSRYVRIAGEGSPSNEIPWETEFTELPTGSFSGSTVSTTVPKIAFPATVNFHAPDSVATVEARSARTRWVLPTLSGASLLAATVLVLVGRGASSDAPDAGVAGRFLPAGPPDASAIAGGPAAPVDSGAVADRIASDAGSSTSPREIAASLQIEATPLTEILVEGVSYGAPPVRLSKLKPGWISVLARRTDVDCARRERIHLAGGDNGTKRIAVEQGEIDFHVHPYAFVSIDGQVLGSVPPMSSQTVCEGRHEVRVVNNELGKNLLLEVNVRGREHSDIKCALPGDCKVDQWVLRASP